ncbi:MAG: hypothetical protein ACYS67_04945 [Planctomycetota bacterium]
MEESAVKLFVGLDVGSSSVHYVVLGEDKKIRYSPNPIMHFADPIGAIKEVWEDITQRFSEDRIKNTSVTGSNAKSFPSVMKGLSYEYDSVTIPKGVELVSPEAIFIFHIGAKDAYFFNVKEINHKKVIQEWRTGTKCGGGSGILIEKQCRRLFEGEIPIPELEKIRAIGDESEKQKAIIRNRQKLQSRLEQIFTVAEKEAKSSGEPSEFLARCGVVIQSDLIHKQNEGAKREDNLAGLFKTVARNYKIDVLGTRDFSTQKSKTAIVTGCVFCNDLIRRNLEESLGIAIARPEHYHNIAAIGAALKGIEGRA